MCKAPNYLAFTGWIMKYDDKRGQYRARDYKFLGHLKHDSVLNTYYDDDVGKELPVIQVPCGQCLECRIQQTRMWADRCVLEAKQYTDNYFVTLTYDDLHVPFNGSLDKRDYQLFLKRLRRKFPGVTIRYMCSGEYGDTTMRPHYHLILFNTPLTDLSDKFKEATWKDKGGKLVIGRMRTHSKPPTGKYPLYYSKTIHECWDYKGMISVGRFSYDTAAYISQYCTKKVNPKNKDKYAELGIIPEFLACSTHPGIGAQYADFKDDLLYSFDKIIIANKDGAHLASVPRYFDKLFIKKYGEDIFQPVRDRRIQKTIIAEKGFQASSRDYDRECEAKDKRLNSMRKLKTAI